MNTEIICTLCGEHAKSKNKNPAKPKMVCDPCWDKILGRTPKEPPRRKRKRRRITNETVEQAKHAVLGYMQHVEEPITRSDVLNATGLDADTWNKVIRRLREERKVEQHGEKRGTTYTVHTPGTRASKKKTKTSNQRKSGGSSKKTKSTGGTKNTGRKTQGKAASKDSA